MIIHNTIPDDNFIVEGKKHLIIIPCCKEKIDPLGIQNNPTYFFNNANGINITNLINTRVDVLDNHPNALIAQNFYDKAWNLYDGHLYKNLKKSQELIENKLTDGKLEIIIISALYGVVNYTSCINKYDLEMDKTRNQWGNIIREAIVQYIEDNKIDTIHSFLRRETYHLAATNDIEFNIRHRAYWADLVDNNPFRGMPKIYKSVADKIIQIIENIN